MSWVVSSGAARVWPGLPDSDRLGQSLYATQGDQTDQRIQAVDRLTIERARSYWAGSLQDDQNRGLLPLLDPDRRTGDVTLGQQVVGDAVAAADRSYLTLLIPEGRDSVDVTVADDGLPFAFPGVGGWPAMPGRSVDEHAYVLLDGFVGETTTRRTYLARIHDGVATVRLDLAQRTGVFVGAILRVIERESSAGSRDLTWAWRLGRAEQAEPQLGYEHPRVTAAPQTSGHVAVVIHGTLSTGMEYLPKLATVSSIPLFRYEHDTMRPVAENAEELTAHLQRIGADQVTLVGHSRGGLVADLVAAAVPEVDEVLTFGTPHRGTPLAGAMDGLLSYAVVALGAAAGSVFAAGLTGAIFSSSLPTSRLPEGWADMRPQSSFIRVLSKHLLPTNLVPYGGVFNPAAAGLGVAPVFKAGMAEVLLTAENDLVVPLASSCPEPTFGTALAQVDHFSYFDHPDVLTYLAAALT